MMHVILVSILTNFLDLRPWRRLDIAKDLKHLQADYMYSIVSAEVSLLFMSSPLCVELLD